MGDDDPVPPGSRPEYPTRLSSTAAAAPQLSIFALPLMSLLPPDPASLTDKELVEDGGDDAVCQPVHCFHAFDTLYCALTDALPIPPAYPNDK